MTAVFIPFTAGGASFWGTSVVLVGYMSFEALMWIFFSELSQRFRLSPIFVFGLGRGVMALAALGGSTLPLFTGALGAPTGLGEMGTVLIVLVAMMLAYALLPDEREMASIVAVTPRKVAVQSASRAPLIVVNEGKADALERAREGAVPSAPEQADVRTQVPANWEHAVVAALAELGETSGAASGQIASASSVVSAADGPTAVDAMQDDASDASAASATASSASNAPSPARQAMDFSHSIFAEETAAPAPAARGRFRQRCEIVANTYLLSRRESEVMYYLARGYKSSHIQQQLYISEGTAKTHIRHIYRKLNIHSQQDLIHLIDEVEL